MKVLTYNEINRLEWMALVASSPTATWFQTPEAYDFFASMPDSYCPFALAIQNHEQPSRHYSCLCVGYITKERSSIRQFFSRRAIIFGGPVLANDCTNEELTMLLNNLSRITSYVQPSPIYIEFRLFHDFSQWRSAFEAVGFCYRPHYDIHVSIDNQSLHLTPNRRRQVSRAFAAGVSVVEASSVDEVRDFYAILHHIYRTRVRVPLPEEEFFISFFEQRRGIYLLVKKDNQVIGGMMCPILPERAIYEWYVCGDDRRYHDLYPSVVATWAAINYAHSHKIPLFDFMGAGEPDVPYGVRDFKMEFGGTLCEYGRFIQIKNNLLYRIGRCVMNILKKI